jgi:hypothetical protein
MSKMNLVPLAIGFFLISIACLFPPWRILNAHQLTGSSVDFSELLANSNLYWGPIWDPPISRSAIEWYPDPFFCLVESGFCIGIPLLVRQALKGRMIKNSPEDTAA